MKRFLSRFALFASIAGILLAIWSGAVMWAEFSTYRRELKMPSGTHILVCGDSQVAHALDPALWPGLFNFSLDASLLDQSRMKLADLLKANPGRADTVLLDISPWKYYVNNPTNALIKEGAAAQQLLLHLLHWRENIRPLSGFAKMFRDLVLVKKGRKLHRLVAKRRPYRSSLCGGYVKTSKAAFIDAQDFAELNIRRISGGINAAPKAGTGTATFDEWTKMLDLVRKAGVKKVVIITTPFHPRLRAAIDKPRLDDFRRAVRAFAARTGCPYLDFLDLNVPDAGWRDGNHLNEVGASIFTAACRKAVTQ